MGQNRCPKIQISDCYENLKSALINRPFRLISRPLVWSSSEKIKVKKHKLNLRIEIAHIEEINCFLDMLSMRMTDLSLAFIREFGRGAQNVRYCSINSVSHTVLFSIHPEIRPPRWFIISRPQSIYSSRCWRMSTFFSALTQPLESGVSCPWLEILALLLHSRPLQTSVCEVMFACVCHHGVELSWSWEKEKKKQFASDFTLKVWNFNWREYVYCR